jgi:hypothetical protein
VGIFSGGERLGAKKSLIHQMLEIGWQIHFGAQITAEFLMFDRRKCADRQAAIADASNQLCASLAHFFGTGKRGKVTVGAVASWMPGVTDGETGRRRGDKERALLARRALSLSKDDKVRSTAW